MGEVILLPKSLRAEWVDVMALDPDLTPTDLRIACIIGFHFNRRRAETFVSQETLAKLSGLAQRTVWSSIARLEQLGYLTVTRRNLGFRTDGRKVCGGRGTANVYSPAFERTKLVATFKGENLATRCDVYWKQRSQSGSRKVATHCDPTLTDPSDQNPSRGRVRASKGPGVPIKPGTPEFDACKKWLADEGREFTLSLLSQAEELGREFLADPRWLNTALGPSTPEQRQCR